MLLLTTKFPGVPGTYLIDLSEMKGHAASRRNLGTLVSAEGSWGRGMGAP